MLRSRKPHLYIYDMHSIYRYIQLASSLVRFVEEVSGKEEFRGQRFEKTAEAPLNELPLSTGLISDAEQGIRLEFFHVEPNNQGRGVTLSNRPSRLSVNK